jgi:LuxR family maltose regulon positive regulatory protein
MKTPLLKSNFFIPPINAGTLIRPRLTEQLTRKLDSKLTLISAPAGYRKTTLLSAWATRCELPVAGLTLDSSDDDLVRFITYMAAALHWRTRT